MRRGVLANDHLELGRQYRRHGQRGNVRSFWPQAIQDHGQVPPPDLRADRLASSALLWL
jgi:hypothetical protein